MVGSVFAELRRDKAREGWKVLSTKTKIISRARAGTEGIRGVNVTAEAPYVSPNLSPVFPYYRFAEEHPFVSLRTRLGVNCHQEK